MTGPIGILGGTFDPVHRGHVDSAAALLSHIDFDLIHFVPNATPSHRDGPATSAAERLAMLQLALRGKGKFFADDREIRRGGISYMVDTLLSLREQYDSDRPFALILGMDAFLGLPTWHQWQRLFELTHVIVVNRPGLTVSDEDRAQSWWQDRREADVDMIDAQAGGRIFEIDITPIDVSSTEIRRRLVQGESVSQMLSPDVLRHIVDHGLYNVGRTKLAEDNNAILLKAIEDGLEDAKARDIRRMDVRDLTDLTDYMVIASGTSDRHVRAMAESVLQSTRDLGQKPGGREGEDTGDWVLLDFGAAIVHVMKQSAREFYDLESLWSEELKVLVAENRENIAD